MQKKKNTMLSTHCSRDTFVSDHPNPIQRGQRRPRSSRRRGERISRGSQPVGASRVVKDEDDDDDDTKTLLGHTTHALLFHSPRLLSFSSLPCRRTRGPLASPVFVDRTIRMPREITDKGLLRGYDPVPFEKGKAVEDVIKTHAIPGRRCHWE